MELKKLLKAAGITTDIQKNINGLAYDSRKVKENYLFFAISGYKEDGNKYIGEALRKGASAVISDNPAAAGENVYHIDDARKAMALVSSEFYGNPSKKLKMIGVTGTNGKTTVTNIIRRGLEDAGSRAAMLGTIDYKIGSESVSSTLTTPDSLEINEMFSKMVNEKIEYCVMEVSSIALTLKRVYGIDYKTAVFTNLSSEHLDLHNDMETYFNAKKILFDNLNPGSLSISNADDEYGKRILESTSSRRILYSINASSDYKAENFSISLEGISFEVKAGNEKFKLASSLTGKFNIYNILASAAALREENIDLETIRRTIKYLDPIPGRFNKIKIPNGAYAIIDYSHTSDSLKNAIEAAINIRQEQKNKGKIITVFGCGGNRDKTKRPVMGKIATELSDLAIITSDNPRFEDPNVIIAEILTGIKKDNFEVEPDRAKAIRESLKRSSENDIILICGKGHETYQEIEGIKSHFDDAEVVRNISKELFG